MNKIRDVIPAKRESRTGQSSLERSKKDGRRAVMRNQPWAEDAIDELYAVKGSMELMKFTLSQIKENNPTDYKTIGRELMDAYVKTTRMQWNDERKETRIKGKCVKALSEAYYGTL